MKKLLCMLLAIALLCAPAFAEETRVSVIEKEGIHEEVVETLYTTEYGYALWYAADLLAPVDMKAAGDEVGAVYMFDVFVPAWYLEVEEEVPDNERIQMTIVPSDVTVDQADGYILEATGGFDPSVAAIGEVTEYEGENGITVKTVDVEENGIIYRFYLVMDAENVVCITASFPVDALEGYAIYFDRMAASIAFAAK